MVNISVVQSHYIEISIMGKKDKSQTNIDNLDELFDDELNDSLDIDEYLKKQTLGSLRRRRAVRERNSSPGNIDDAERYRLPGDWRDFDYTSDHHSQEDWD